MILIDIAGFECSDNNYCPQNRTIHMPSNLHAIYFSQSQSVRQHWRINNSQISDRQATSVYHHTYNPVYRTVVYTESSQRTHKTCEAMRMMMMMMTMMTQRHQHVVASGIFSRCMFVNSIFQCVFRDECR